MRVLHMISGGDSGGARTHVFTLASKLQEVMDFDLICFMDGDFYRDALRRRIRVELIPQRGRYDLAVIPRILRRIRERKYDLIHAHGARANFLAAAMKPFVGLPILTTIHSDYRLDFQGEFYKQLVYTNLNAWALRLLDTYVAVSEEFRNMLVRRGFPRERIHVVYNGIDFDTELPSGERAPWVKAYGLPFAEEELWVVSVGRLHPVKGHEILIRAAGEVLRNRSDTRFLIAGEGSERGRLERLIHELGLRDYVHLLGHVKNADALLAAADVNVISSYSESFPYTLLEGARMRRATISTRVGGVPDLLVDGENGYITEPGDVEGLARKLLDLLADDEKRTRYGNRLYEDARRCFSAEQLRDRHMEIYGRVLRGRSARGVGHAG